ncbi:MAG: TonB-dependent siderophore receptor [Pseudomonadota bacterium]
MKPTVPREVIAGAARLVVCAALVFSLPTTAGAQQSTQLPGIIVTGGENAQSTGDATPTVIDGRPVTETPAGPVDGYRAITGSIATKTETPIRETPQTINVIPGLVIQDQRANNVAEALRNVSGVQPQPEIATPATENTVVRGFRDFYTRTWVDGFPVLYGAGDLNSLVNVERIEVLKGPSAILYGGGVGEPVGGVINIVTKKPEAKTSGKIGIKFGSFRHLQPFFDINQPVTENVRFRFTGDYTSKSSVFDVAESERYNLNPSLLFTNNDTTSLLLQARFSRWSQQEYQGLPAVGTVAGSFRLRPSLFIGPRDVPDSFSNHDAITATLKHKFNDTWSTELKGRLSQSDFEESAQAILNNSPDFPPSTWGLFNAELAQQQREATVSGHVIGKFQAGIVSNTILIGADFSKVEDEGYLKSAFVGVTDLTNPSFPDWVDPYDGPNDLFVDSTTAGLTAQWQGKFWNRLHITASARLAHITQDYTDTGTGNRSELEETAVLPRIGAVIDITRSVSLFAGYSQGMRAQPFTVYVNEPEPERTEQIEGGIKFNFSNQFAGTLSVYEINRENVPVFLANFTTDTAGLQRSRGFEADVTWQIGPAWKILASYAYTNAEFLTAVETAGIQVGNTPFGVPDHSGRLWVNYAFQDPTLKGLKVGVGIYASSEKFVTDTNALKTDAFYSVDATVSYETKQYEAALSFKNLTDNDYFDSYPYFDGRVYQPAGFAAYGTLALKW